MLGAEPSSIVPDTERISTTPEMPPAVSTTPPSASAAAKAAPRRHLSCAWPSASAPSAASPSESAALPPPWP